MARDDRFKRVSGVGADFLETARAKAEELLRELSRTGEDTQERAQGAVDDLIEGGRRGTEQLIGLIRREITDQLGALGLATKEDLAALERRLTAATSSSPARRSAPTRATSGQAGPAKATAAKTTAAKTTAAKTTAAKATAAKATAARTGTSEATGRKATNAAKASSGGTKKAAKAPTRRRPEAAWAGILLGARIDAGPPSGRPDPARETAG